MYRILFFCIINFFMFKIKNIDLHGKMFTDLLNKKQIKINNKIIKLKDISFLEKGKKIVYATDTKSCKATIKNSIDADILIHEATYIENEKALAKERKHSTALEAANIIFHISARYKNTNILANEIKTVFKNAEIAKDGLIIEV